MRIAVVFFASCLILSARADEPPAFWTPEELRLIDRGLEVLNLERRDLGFQKRPIDDPFRLDVVNRALDDPLSIGGEAQAWDDVARGGRASDLLARAVGLLQIDPTWGLHGTELDRAALAEIESHLPPSSLPAFEDLVAAVRWLHVVGAEQIPTRNLEDVLLEKALRNQIEAPEGAPPPAMEDDRFLQELPNLRRSVAPAVALKVLRAVETFTVALKGGLKDSPTDWRGKLELPLPFAKIVLCGVQDDQDIGAGADLRIDLGGSDTYSRGAFADAGRGAVLIDVAGDDLYLGGNDVSFGAALGGVAIQWDCAGNDTYRAGHASLGAGILGVGILVDEAGDDVYRVKDFGIGAGAYGIGVFLDLAGNDDYHADLFGEGFASTWGCGVLADLAGNDVYDAGGAHLHAPLYRDRYQTLSQGFSIGSRPDASGGVGVLVDVKGNDRYAADIYGQGSSYWFSLGILVDDDGNDVYTAGHYAQGTGIHLSAGILLDRAGEDLYYTMNGVGIGGAHDFAVGMLVDRAGDDHYAGSGGSQGGALTNSVAILLDGGGNDGYSAVRIGGSQGSATSARNTGGIGLLLDAGGKDLYSETTRDETTWEKDWVGAGIDAPTPPDVPAVAFDAPTITKEAAEAKVAEAGADLEKLWKMACEWEVGDNRVVVPIARERLVALGAPALDRAFERIGTKEGLEFRAVEAMLKAVPKDQVLPRLLEKTKEKDAPVRKGALKALTGLALPEAYDRLAEMLDDEEVRGSVLEALSSLKRAPARVKEFLRAQKELQGVAAAACLGAAGDADSLRALVAALDLSYPYLVRIAAEQQLAAREAALPDVVALAVDTTASRAGRRSALRVLGRTKSPGAAAAIEKSLGDGDPLVKLSARLAAKDLLDTLPDPKPETLVAALAAATAELRPPPQPTDVGAK